MPFKVVDLHSGVWSDLEVRMQHISLECKAMLKVMIQRDYKYLSMLQGMDTVFQIGINKSDSQI